MRVQWRKVATIVVALTLSHPFVGRADDTRSTPLAGRLDAAVAAFHGTASIVVRDVLTGQRYAHDAERVFPAASLFKLGVMVEAYRRVAAGSLSLGTTFTVEDEDDEGSYTAAGETLTLADAIERMITLSDNTTAHMLVRSFGAQRINETAAAIGLTDTRLNRFLGRDERSAPFNTTSARDMERLFAGLLRGSVVGPIQSALMLGTLARQRVNDRLPAGLPAGTFVAHKTGNLDGVAHDAGVIATPTGTRIVVVLTADYASYEEVTLLARRVAEAAYDVGPAAFAARDRLGVSAPVLGQGSTESDSATLLAGPGEEAEPSADEALSTDASIATRVPASAFARRGVPAEEIPLLEPSPLLLLAPPGRFDATRSPDSQAWIRTPWWFATQPGIGATVLPLPVAAPEREIERELPTEWVPTQLVPAAVPSNAARAIAKVAVPHADTAPTSPASASGPTPAAPSSTTTTTPSAPLTGPAPVVVPASPSGATPGTASTGGRTTDAWTVRSVAGAPAPAVAVQEKASPTSSRTAITKAPLDVPSRAAAPQRSAQEKPASKESAGTRAGTSRINSVGR